MALNTVIANAANKVLDRQGGTKAAVILSEFTGGTVGTNTTTNIGTARELARKDENIVAGWIDFTTFPDDGDVYVNLYTGRSATLLTNKTVEQHMMPKASADTLRDAFVFTVFGSWYELELQNASTTAADIAVVGTLAIVEY